MARLKSLAGFGLRWSVAGWMEGGGVVDYEGEKKDQNNGSERWWEVEVTLLKDTSDNELLSGIPQTTSSYLSY